MNAVRRPIFALALSILCTAAVAQPQEPSAPLPSPSPPEIVARTLAMRAIPHGEQPSQAFQVHLLVASLGSGEASFEGLSKNAQKALQDLKDFLPFTSYQLLDFAWLRSSGMTTARLRGLVDRGYTVTLGHRSPSEETGGQLFVSHFELREDRAELLDAERVAPPGVPREALVLPRPRSSLISTSFRMDVGETVVVGTSRLDGERKALVALLTAVPEK